MDCRYDVNLAFRVQTGLDALQSFIDDGLLEVTRDRLTVVGAGRLVLRNIAMCFDAYLGKMSSSKPIFSRTV